MPKSTPFSNSFLALVFNASAIPLLADNAASAPATALYLSLHTSSPGVGGAQTSNETSYTNYVRVPVLRTIAGWTVGSAQAVNSALIQFAQCGVSGTTLTHVAIGTALSGAGQVLYAGALNSSLAVSDGIQPQFAASALTVTES